MDSKLNICVFCHKETTAYDNILKEYAHVACVDKFYDEWEIAERLIINRCIDKEDSKQPKYSGNPNYYKQLNIKVYNKYHRCPVCKEECNCDDEECSHCN